MVDRWQLDSKTESSLRCLQAKATWRIKCNHNSSPSQCKLIQKWLWYNRKVAVIIKLHYSAPVNHGKTFQRVSGLFRAYKQNLTTFQNSKKSKIFPKCGNPVFRFCRLFFPLISYTWGAHFKGFYIRGKKVAKFPQPNFLSSVMPAPLCCYKIFFFFFCVRHQLSSFI